jgi:cell division protein FtsI (penicillin-binding protein 3)
VQISNPDAAARTLSRLLHVPAKEVRSRLARKSNFVWIKRQVGDKAAARIRRAGLDGVYLTTEYSRFYPNKHLAGQLIGFVGVDGSGLEGLERSFDERLTGRKAQFVVQRDASGRKLYLDAQGREVDMDGRDLVLTLDAAIQAACEEALAHTVRKFGGRSGAALVVDADTGGVLAWVNYPFFNPNTFRHSSPSRWRDRAALDVFEPGSTMKPFLYAAAVEEGVVQSDKLIDCEDGVMEVNGHPIRDTHPHRWLSARRALLHSSNIGMAKIGMSLGAPAFHRHLTALGFGRRPELPLPGLGQGLLREPSQWNEIDLAAASFGQGVGVTAVQMAQAFLCLANHGVRKPLRIVQEPARKPEEDGRRVFSKDVSREVLSIMREVVERDDGTGRRARIPGLSMAGKTGTAQKASPEGGYGEKHLASFAALIPAEDPELLVLVVVDEPTKNHYGGVVAAPAAREMTLRTLAHLGRPVADPGCVMAEAEPEDVPRWRCQGAALAPRPDGSGRGLPDFSGMTVRRAVEILAKKGVIPRIHGDGPLVARQKPEPGAKPASGRGVSLWLAQSGDRG